MQYKRSAVTLAAVVIYGGVPALSSAQDAGLPTRNTDGGGIPEVMVTAQRRAERIQDVPLSVAARSAEDLERAGVDSTLELTKVVPGLTFDTNGAWAQPAIRGVSTTVTGPGNDSPIAIYVDGIYHGNEVGNSFDLPDIERVEVLKGPQGTLFGRNATGGAIRLITREPSNQLTGDAKLSFGAYDGAGSSHSAREVTASVYLSGPLTERVRGSIALFRSDDSGFQTNDVTNKSFGNNQSTAARAKVQIDPTDDLKVLLIGYWSDRATPAANAGTVIDGLSIGAGFPGSVISSQPWHLAFDYQPEVWVRTHGGSLRVEWKLDAGTLSSQSSYTNTYNQIKIDVDGSYSPACLQVYACTNFWARTPENSVQEELQFASTQLGPISYVVGANYYSSAGSEPFQIDDFNDPHVVAPGLSNDGPVFTSNVFVRTRAAAIFGEINYDISSRWVAILGARESFERKVGYGKYAFVDIHDLPQFVEKRYTNFSPRASLRYKVTDRSNAYFTYSRGFKSGVVPYSNFTQPATDPETIDAFEIGYKASGAHGDVSIAAFHYNYKGLQVLSGNGQAPIVNNAANAKIEGLDLDATAYFLADRLRLHGGVSYLPTAKFTDYKDAVVFDRPFSAPFGFTQYSGDISGHRLFRTPKLQSSLSADYTWTAGRDEFNAGVSLYGSSFYTVEASELLKGSGYVTVGAQLAYRPADTGFKVTVWGRNLTNKAVLSGMIASQPSLLAIYLPPRQLGVSLSYEF